MFRHYSALVGSALLVSTAPLSAQTVLASPQTAATLRSGTPVPLRMSEALTTEGKKLRVGQRFQMEVAEPVTIGGRVVIPAGSPATGEVTDVRNKGMWGKSGGINARVLFVRVDGRQIRLTGQTDDKGVTGTAGVVGALVVVPIAGFFVTGTSARIPLGAPVKAFLDEDVPIMAAAAISQPIIATAPPVPEQPKVVTASLPVPAESPRPAQARAAPVEVAVIARPVPTPAPQPEARFEPIPAPPAANPQPALVRTAFAETFVPQQTVSALSPYEQGRQQGLAALADAARQLSLAAAERSPKR